MLILMVLVRRYYKDNNDVNITNGSKNPIIKKALQSDQRCNLSKESIVIKKASQRQR